MAGNEPRYVIEIYRVEDDELFFRMGLESGERAAELAKRVKSSPHSSEYEVVVIDTKEGTIMR